MSNPKRMYSANFRLVYFFKKILKCTFLCTYKSCLTTKKNGNMNDIDDYDKSHTLILEQINMLTWKIET